MSSGVLVSWTYPNLRILPARLRNAEGPRCKAPLDVIQHSSTRICKSAVLCPVAKPLTAVFKRSRGNSELERGKYVLPCLAPGCLDAPGRQLYKLRELLKASTAEPIPDTRRVGASPRVLSSRFPDSTLNDIREEYTNAAEYIFPDMGITGGYVDNSGIPLWGVCIIRIFQICLPHASPQYTKTARRSLSCSRLRCARRSA